LIAIAYEKELDNDWDEHSDENLVEAYVIAILNKCEKNLKFLEQELMERKLFLVALERYDLKKSYSFQ
jgi:hypothetical protein